MTVAPTLTRCLALCVFLALEALTPSLADEQTPRELIAGLGDRLYAVGETTGHRSDMQSAIDDVVAALRQRVVQGDDPALTAGDDRGRTPLITAAARGFSEVVEVLLESEAVREAIDATDATELSAWDHATLAIHQSIWACQQFSSAQVFKWIPRMVTAFWYASDEPYQRTQQLIEDAGATTDMEQPRAFWLKSCRTQTRDTREAVTHAIDLQETVIEQGELAFQRVLEAGRNGQ